MSLIINKNMISLFLRYVPITGCGNGTAQCRRLDLNKKAGLQLQYSDYLRSYYRSVTTLSDSWNYYSK